MPVDSTLVGRSFPPTAPYLVGREKIREFARAVLATSPLHFDPEAARAAGYADVVAPPTFAVVVQGQTIDQILTADPEAPLELSRVVHADQRFSFARPIVAGDELTVAMTVTGVRSLGGNAIVTSESRVVDAAGSTVSTVVATLVIGGEGA